MRGTRRISKRLKILGGAAIAAAMMVASAQAATAFDLTAGLGAGPGSALLEAFGQTAVPEPAALMIVGTILLTAFRSRPHA
jgi:predicted MFS family arabinose efflux permease